MNQAEHHYPLEDYVSYPEDEMLARAKAHYFNIRRRHTIRDFSDKPVAKEIIEECIKAAATAPSGANHQPWHFVAISDRSVKSQIREEAEALERTFYEGRAGEEWLDALKPLGTDAHKPYLEKAPWLIAIFSQKRGGIENDNEQTNYYVHESVGIATGFLIQALHNAGLVTLTHTPKPMSFLKKVCGRDNDNDNDRPYMLIIAGYPEEGATIPEHATKKKEFEEIATFL
ncbi:nitroreductase family protein [Veronia nyctiphanis]|uniref:Nitroreductase family protein n=1 Tax=Veronia nyctiphanis TaxID=1278244 RepID=A0A4Q0YNP7_9GAMM|nr:nitroreductase family protein [Veronia nyctiphanis]RXJ71838.1 nitroreductase family protein [Veronia nyctiphanis]RXJ72590.1 nitroreductase family protein [Veronia nyctiphanis]